uniref:Uncharacterized protein n=1 Tax=Vespula pensylvanica TaxID=30213 RepID=A0A834PBX5_VESPE|nr:hypothetical protein H0235_003478 [Vespula pensylvanica]
MKTFSSKVTLLTCPMYNVERVYERSKRVPMINTLFTCVLVSQNFKKNKNNNVGFVEKVIVDSGIRNPDLPEVARTIKLSRPLMSTYMKLEILDYAQ